MTEVDWPIGGITGMPIVGVVGVPMVGVVGVPIVGNVGVPIVGESEVPIVGSVGVPMVGVLGVPILGTVDVPIAGLVGVPIVGLVDVPIVGAVDVPMVGSVGVPMVGSVGVPIVGKSDVPLVGNVAKFGERLLMPGVIVVWIGGDAGELEPDTLPVWIGELMACECTTEGNAASATTATIDPMIILITPPCAPESVSSLNPCPLYRIDTFIRGRFRPGYDDWLSVGATAPGGIQAVAQPRPAVFAVLFDNGSGASKHARDNLANNPLCTTSSAPSTLSRSLRFRAMRPVIGASRFPIAPSARFTRAGA